jgi:hypothetical protein
VQYSGGSGPVSVAYAGLPPGCSSQSTPTLPCWPVSAGTYNVTVTLNDSGGNRTSASLTLHVVPTGSATGPQITAFSLAPPALVLGNGTTISIQAQNGTPPLTYDYAGLPASCAAADNASISCVPSSAGIFELTLTVSDNVGLSASLETNLTVYPVGGGGAGAEISGFSAAPYVLPIGNSTVLEVLATGGVGPLGFDYPVLPPGCRSTNSSVLTCLPNSSGSFRTYVVVTDSAGHRTAAFGPTIIVRAAITSLPVITLFGAAPSSVTLGGRLTLFVEAAGGVPPLSYAYGGLPSGCLTTDSASLTCTPTATGSFTVTITLTDDLGHQASSTTPVEVIAGSTPTGGAGSGLPDLSVLGSSAGLATLAFLMAAVLFYVGVEVGMRQRAVRLEGEEIVRTLSENAAREAGSSAAPPTRPGPR